MQQPPIHRCSRCGTVASADQRFCSNCGAVIDRDVVNPTAPVSEPNFAPGTPPPPPNLDQYATFRQQSNYTPPPPDVPSYHQQPTENSFTPPYTGSTLGQSATPPVYSAPPVYARPPQKDNTGKILGRIGCGAGLLILLGLLLCGGLSYGLYTVVSKSVNKSVNSATNSYGTGTTNTVDATPTPAPIKTTPLNLSLKYSAITYTIVDMKQAASFADDHENSAPGIVRVDLKEVNSTNNSVILGYPDVTRLILPNQSSIPPQNYKNLSPPAKDASQDNWLDFPVPQGTPTNKLILRFGTSQEAQMDIPLTPGANLAQFQDVTTKPNTATTYSGLKWTLTSATLGWSAYGKQAENGKRYVTINVSIDNPTANGKSAYWGNYLRLQAGALTSTPETDSTIPTSFAASSTGATGSASFLVPQGSSTFTLILLAGQIDTADPQTTIDFHIP